MALSGGAGVTSLALALCAAPTSSGLWLGCLNVPSRGWAAAAELGVDLCRVATVDVPERELAAATAVMIDVFDLVLCGDLRPLTRSHRNKLLHRARERGRVLVTLGDRPAVLVPGRSDTAVITGERDWLPDVSLHVEGSRWSGLGAGRGRLRGRRLWVTVRERRAASPSWSCEVHLPPAGGGPVVEAEVQSSAPTVHLCWSDGTRLEREPSGSHPSVLQDPGHWRAG